MTYETNAYIRSALTCPFCERRGTIRPQRDPFAAGLSINMFCVGELMNDGDDNGCGRIGLFEPDPSIWMQLAPADAAKHVQAWLLEQKEGRRDPISKLGDVARLDHEVEALRAGVAQMADGVHKAYHRESEGDWRSCPYGACATARKLLGIS